MRPAKSLFASRRLSGSIKRFVNNQMFANALTPAHTTDIPTRDAITKAISKGAQWVFLTEPGSVKHKFVLGLDGFTEDDDWILG